MPLYVSVVSYQGHPPAHPIDATFDENGGTIGRSEDSPVNHLTLPDPNRYISRIHATITYQNGIYTLTDNSVDGIYINNRHNRVGKSATPLSDGDRLWIGDYQLIVNIQVSGTDLAFAKDVDPHGLSLNRGDIFDQADETSKNSQYSPLTHESQEDWWSDGNFWESDESSPPSAGESDGAPIHEAFAPPDISDNAEPTREIPQDFNFRDLFTDLDGSGDDRMSSKTFGADVGPGESEQHRANPPSDRDLFENRSFPHDGKKRNNRPEDSEPAAANLGTRAGEPGSTPLNKELVQCFVEAAGLPDPSSIADVDPAEFMRTMGAVFKEMILGLMTVLRGRKELKTHLNIAATSIRPEGNNPLKFFREADEALRQMLTGDPPGFIDTQSAVREGFSDIMNHQIALNAGLQAAVLDLINRFDPQEVAKHQDNGGVLLKKAKAWSAYREAYQALANDALEDIFGKPFCDAYEAQIRKLTANTKKQ